MGNNNRKIIFPFHTAETQIADGDELNIGLGMIIMNIAVSGNATGFTLVFEGKSNDTDDYTPIMCCNLATLVLSTTAIANGKYQMSLEGLIKVRVRLSAITTNAVTVKGTVTD